MRRTRMPPVGQLPSAGLGSPTSRGIQPMSIYSILNADSMQLARPLAQLIPSLVNSTRSPPPRLLLHGSSRASSRLLSSWLLFPIPSLSIFLRLRRQVYCRMRGKVPCGSDDIKGGGVGERRSVAEVSVPRDNFA